jgi:hypothetical protein
MKWFFFTLGFLPAVIIVMAATLVATESEVVRPPSHSLNSQSEVLMLLPSGTGTAAGGAGGPSGGITTQNDYLWILYIRRPPEKERKLLGKGFLDQRRFSVASYRATAWGGWTRQGSVKLLATRDITYDLKLISLDRKGMREYTQIRNAWDDALKKLEKRNR